MKRGIKHLRWIIAGLVFLSTVINYIDRQVLSVLAPQITKELGINNVEYGYIVQAFLVSYTMMYIVAGIIIDRWGVKIVYGMATIWWSVAAILHAFVRSTLGFVGVRFLLGIGESFNFICAQKVAAEWYPPKERALLNGLANAAAVTGAIITPPISVWIMYHWGWKAAFVSTGCLGFLWVVPWLVIYYLPDRHPRITTEELELIKGRSLEAAQTESLLHVSGVRWVELVKYRETWSLLLARVFSDPVWWFYLFWLPKFLTESKGFSMAEVGMLVWIPYLASDVGSVAGGWLSGVLIGRGWSVCTARKAVMLGSALMMPLGIITVFTKSTVLAIVIICIVLFAHMSWKTNLMTLTVDVFPKAVVGSVAGILGTGGGIGSAIFTSMAGYVIEWYSYIPVFVIMGIMHPIGYLYVHWWIRAKGVGIANHAGGLEV